MICLSLDQSTTTCGWCVIETSTKKILDYGNEVFDTGNKNNPKPIEEKIHNVKQWLIPLIKKYNPEIFAIEDIQFQQNQQVYKVLAELLGVISNLYYEKEYLFKIITPSQWKGYIGIKSKKREDQKKETQEYIKNVFNLDVTQDEADAIGIGIYMSDLIENRMCKK